MFNSCVSLVRSHCENAICLDTNIALNIYDKKAENTRNIICLKKINAKARYNGYNDELNKALKIFLIFFYTAFTMFFNTL